MKHVRRSGWTMTAVVPVTPGGVIWSGDSPGHCVYSIYISQMQWGLILAESVPSARIITERVSIEQDCIQYRLDYKN